MLYYTEWNSPLGDLVIASTDDKLCLCDWKYRRMRETVDKRIKSFYQSDFNHQSNPIIEQTITQLSEYFSRERKKFELPIQLIGTAFQIQVWDELMNIEYGKTKSYLTLSKDLKNEKAIRAVATANGANAISIIIPCHRVMGSDGSLVGYAGGLSAKKKLLEIEMAAIQPSLF